MSHRAVVAIGTVLILSLGASNGPFSAQFALAGDGKLKFEIYQDSSKEYRWRLKGPDDKLLATAGQGYAAKADCKKGVDRLINDLDKQKFEVYEDKGKEHRWRLLASNGQVVAASSHGYATKAECEKAIDTVKKGAPKAEMSEEKAKEK